MDRERAHSGVSEALQRLATLAQPRSWQAHKEQDTELVLVEKQQAAGRAGQAAALSSHLPSNESVPLFGSLGSPGDHHLSKELFHQQGYSLEERPARPSSAWAAASPADKGSS